MKKIRSTLFLLALALVFSACSSRPEQDPNFILTVVASTQRAAALQTERAAALATKTPTQNNLRPTFTLEPTATLFVFNTSTPVPSPTFTRAPRIRTSWPDWKSGDVIKLQGVSSGTNKKFSGLTGLKVIVVRKNGVKLRSTPSNAIGGPLEEIGSAFVLTGVMNKDPKRDWLYAQVIAANGRTYWVGGSIETQADPTISLVFYYPELTVSPTPSITPTSTAKPPTATKSFEEPTLTPFP